MLIDLTALSNFSVDQGLTGSRSMIASLLLCLPGWLFAWGQGTILAALQAAKKTNERKEKIMAADSYQSCCLGSPGLYECFCLTGLSIATGVLKFPTL